MTNDNKKIELLDKLMNNLTPQEYAIESARRLATGFNDGSNKLTYRIDPIYEKILGPSFDIFFNMSRVTVFCDGVQREITQEHYQALQTYIHHQIEQLKARTVRSNFDGKVETGDYRRIK